MTLRSATAVLLIIVTGLPVVGALCVRECDAPTRAAVEADAHCHDPGASDTASIESVAPERCNPFITTAVATLERSGTPVGSAPATPPYLQFTETASELSVTGRVASHLQLTGAGIRIGTRLPLRI